VTNNSPSDQEESAAIGATDMRISRQKKKKIILRQLPVKQYNQQ